ncbi:DUF3742 family protein [Pseudomonas caricapapayae]|uniref:DUF3742 family protein n=1 Tax=Pseudomonas caricapapayae TaxID=46678 RepID=UPI000EFE77C0|nr:DUF3742 family protein [Pseudomonas caricapapayae]
MITKQNESVPAKLGYVLGRTFRSIGRMHRWGGQKAASLGLPSFLGRGLAFLVAGLALGVVLYTTFWALAVLVAVFVFHTFVRERTAEGSDHDVMDFESKGPQWEMGPQGFGEYAKGYRIDSGE